MDLILSLNLIVFILCPLTGTRPRQSRVHAYRYLAPKNIIRSLVIGLTVVTIVYLLVNWSYLRVLGLGGMASSRNVALDLVKNAIGPAFVPFLTFCVVFAVLSTMNATIISGARSNYALGRDFKIFGFIGKWNDLYC